MSENPYDFDDCGLDPEAVTRLLNRARLDVDNGLLDAAQVALARGGRVIAQESYGTAGDDSLICIFSITKAIVAAATWLLLQDGQLSEDQPVAEIIPEFGGNGKQRVTLGHLLTHTGGFPGAPFNPADWASAEKKLERFARWRLNWEPGSRYEYHPTSSMWVIAEVIERVTGSSYQGFVRERILEPLGLKNVFLGLPQSVSHRALPVSFKGNAVSPQDYENPAFTRMASGEVTEAALLAFNHEGVRSIGIPGAGAFATAADIALLFQAFMHGGVGAVRIWSENTLQDVLRIRFAALTDDMFACAANRALGLAVAGDEDRVFRGFGAACSDESFGHNGTGCQVAWSDPVSGISFCYLTPSHERDISRQHDRSLELSGLAAQCAL